MPAIGERLFGSGTRTKILTALAMLGETYPREVSSIIGLPLFSVQRIFADLEDQGIVASRLRGTVRLTTLATTSPFKLELQALLLRMAEEDKNLMARLAKLRRRPRAPGKTI